MAYVAKTCPSCGGTLGDTPFCPYCGAKVEEEKIKIEVSGGVNIIGNPTEKTLLSRALQLCEERKFAQANELCDSALNANPECSFAHFIKFMCKKGFPTPKSVFEQLEFESFYSDTDFRRAMEFGEKDGMIGTYNKLRDEAENIRSQKKSAQEDAQKRAKVAAIEAQQSSAKLESILSVIILIVFVFLGIGLIYLWVAYVEIDYLSSETAPLVILTLLYLPFFCFFLIRSIKNITAYIRYKKQK